MKPLESWAAFAALLVVVGAGVWASRQAVHSGRAFASALFSAAIGAGLVLAIVVLRRQSTKARQSAAWLESLVTTTQDGIVSIDHERRIVLFNPAAQRIFGYSAEEIRGEKVNVLMGEPYARDHDAYVERYESTGERHAIGLVRTVQGRRKDGETFPLELSVTEIAGETETRYVAFLRDVSARVRLQDELLLKERLATLGAAAATLAHEIGNPLQGMSLNMVLLERTLARQGPAVDPRAHGLVSLVRSEIERLSGLLQEVRSLARRDSLQLRPTPLPQVVEHVVRGTGLIGAGRIRVVQDYAPDLPPVLADADRLKQVFVNLFQNAAEAMESGGELKVKGRRVGADVVVEVADTGAGVADGLDPFEAFRTTKPNGTGLGLAIVRHIVAAHGGTIHYTSAAGRGTTFTLKLPAALEKAPPAA